MRSLTARVAILAAALNALAPLLAQAQPKDPLLTATICSSDGGAHAVDLSGKAPGGKSEHCKFCLSGGTAALVTITSVTTEAAFATNHSEVVTEVLFPSTNASPAPPRGPPPIL